MEDFVDAGCRNSTENVDVVELFVVDSKPNPAGFLRYDDHRARVRRRGMLYEASHEILVQNSVHLFGHEMFHAIGARGHRGAVGWDRNFERQEGARTKVGRWRGKESANSIKVSPNWVMTSGSQPGPWKSNEISRRCVFSLCQTRSYRAGRSLSDQARK